jgi:hypothetical protein
VERGAGKSLADTKNSNVRNTFLERVPRQTAEWARDVFFNVL